MVGINGLVGFASIGSCGSMRLREHDGPVPVDGIAFPGRSIRRMRYLYARNKRERVVL